MSPVTNWRHIEPIHWNHELLWLTHIAGSHGPSWIVYVWLDLPKGSYTCTVSRHTFYHYLLTTSMDQQHMCLILLKLEQSAFTQASFSNLSDVHKHSGGLLKSPIFPWKADSWTESPHTCLMSFSMDLAALCDMWRWKWHQCKSLGCF